MRNLTLLVALSAMFSLVFAVSCGDDDGGSGSEICTDGVDNDGDGLIDCGDQDCIGTAACTNNCGNGACEPQLGETAASCPADCGTTGYCGDGNCDAGLGENETTCAQDCSSAGYCGDGTCDPATEDANNCAADCGGSGTCTAPADLVSDTGCQAGETCTLVGQNTPPDIGCGPIGTNANYADCGNQQGCLAGAVCAGDGTANSCMPFCDLNGGSTCPDSGICMYQLQTAAGPVGLCALPDNCDPVAQTGCGAGEACYITSQVGDTSCLTAGTMALGDSCQYVNDCSPAMLCNTTCMELCEGDGDCTGTTCQGIGQLTSLPAVGICQ